MTILMTGGDKPLGGWDDRSCPHCGSCMDWADCWMIDCEEGYYDLGEQDCINYDPGTYAKCQECDGNGGWWYCPNKSCKPNGPTSSEQQK